MKSYFDEFNAEFEKLHRRQKFNKRQAFARPTKVFKNKKNKDKYSNNNNFDSEY